MLHYAKTHDVSQAAYDTALRDYQVDRLDEVRCQALGRPQDPADVALRDLLRLHRDLGHRAVAAGVQLPLPVPSAAFVLATAFMF